MGIQIELFTNYLACLLGARRRLHVIADAGLWITLADDDFLQIHIAIGGCRTYLLDTFHLNLLHKFLVIGINGIQPEHHVIDVTLTVGCTIE